MSDRMLEPVVFDHAEEAMKVPRRPERRTLAERREDRPDWTTGPKIEREIARFGEVVAKIRTLDADLIQAFHDYVDVTTSLKSLGLHMKADFTPPIESAFSNFSGDPFWERS